MAAGEVWLRVPRTMKFIYSGKRKPFVTGKDLILATIRKTGVDGCLYKAMEFSGEVIERLPLDDRFTMCNMAIEAGAKNGIVALDETTRAFADATCRRPSQNFRSDGDAIYDDCIEIAVGDLEPQVAFPICRKTPTTSVTVAGSPSIRWSSAPAPMVA